MSSLRDDRTAKEGNSMQENLNQRPSSPIEPQEGQSPLAQDSPASPRGEQNVKRDTQKGQGLTNPSGAFCGISLNMLREAIHSKRQTEQHPDLVLAIPQEPSVATQEQNEPQPTHKVEEKGVPVWEKIFRIGGAVVATATSILAQPPREVSAQDIHQVLEASKLTAQTQIQQEGMPSQRAVRQTATGLEVQQEAIKQSPQEIEVIVEVTNFENLDMQVTGDGRAGALIKRPFGNGTQVNVALGELDVSGTIPKLKLEVKGTAINIEDPRSIAISETDPNTAVVVGKHSFIVTTDRFQHQAEIAVPNGWFAKGVIISPDNAYAYIPLLGNGKGPGVLIYKFATGDKIAQEVQFNGTQPSDSQYLLWPTKPYHVLPNQPLYRAYASLWNNPGYVELTLEPTGVQGKILNPQESYPTGPTTQFFDSQNRNRVWHIDSSASFSQAVFDNIDNVQQPGFFESKIALYPSDTRKTGIRIVAVDVTTGKFYMATVAVDNNQEFYRPFIEEGSLPNPTDMNQRRLMPTNGNWPALLDPPNTNYRISILTKDSTKYFVASFGPQGIRTLRVPDGQPTGTDGNWAVVSAQVTEHRVYAPIVTKNATSSW